MFRLIAAGLVAGLLLKDLSFVGDRYIIRTAIEVASLLLGVYWLLTHASMTVLRRQTLAVGYLFALLLSAFVSSDPPAVLLQVIALGSVMLFSIAYFASTDTSAAVRTVLVPTLCVYAVVLAGCLICAQVAPTVAFIHDWGNPIPRFRGVFGEPAQLGMVAGIALGLSVFVRTWWIVRVPAFVVAVVCVYYTYSRTFWIAVVAGLAVTLWAYKPKLRIPMATAACIAAFIVALAGISYVDEVVKSNQRLLRSDSLMNLSGRTAIWGEAVDAFKDRPLLGYGFTLGADGIMNSNVIEGMSRSNGRGGQFVNTPTLHNGYVQAMLDAGALGLALYCAIVIAAFVQLWRRDTDKRFAPVMYILVFSMVGNVGETFIFGAAQSHQALYWMMAVFALGLVDDSVRAPPPVMIQIRFRGLIRPRRRAIGRRIATTPLSRTGVQRYLRQSAMES